MDSSIHPLDLELDVHECPLKERSLYVADECVFAPDVQDWLLDKIGKYGVKWCWRYQWIGESPLKGKEVMPGVTSTCVVAVVFSNARDTFLFSIRWSEYCLDIQESN